MTKLARALVACCATLALAAGVIACGGGSDDKAAVQSQVKTIFSGFAGKDAGKICGSLSKKYKERITKRPLGNAGGNQSCEKVMALVLSIGGKQLNQVNQTKIAGVKVDGTNATADVVYKGGKKGKVVLTKEDGGWRVNNFNFR
jgi:hypothetical protein